MGDKQRAEAHGQPGGQLDKALQAVEPDGKVAPEVEKRHKEQTQGHAGDDVGIHHGDVVDGHQRVPDAPAHGIKTDGGKGAGYGGDDGREQGDQKRGIDALHDQPVPEELFIPLQGETLPDGIAVAGVEGKDDEQHDGSVQKDEHQSHEHTAEKGIGPFHSITACSSPSPKRFITTMHTTTISIITSEMAAPSWGL